MLVADLGCGKFPWFLGNQQIRKDRGIGTPLSNAHCGIPEGTTYFCVDNRHIHYAESWFEEFLTNHSNLFNGEIRFISADARRPGLRKQSLDMVIVSDVLSIPPPGHSDTKDWDGPGTSNREKKQIVESAINLLHQDGILIITAYQTPYHGKKLFDYLLNTEPQITQIEQFGSLKPYGELDHCICEFVFKKTSERDTIKPKIYPLNERQIAYLNQWSWDC
ncbi:MAG: hypothetical protein HY438_00605 [DPANN group archaeon]|nr:hypothetical protein [DPANN group archaeon]